jgi:hypothetical protein
MRKNSSSKRIFLFAVFISALSLITYFLLLYKAPEFITKTERITANTLLVEGWIPENMYPYVESEFRNHHYDYIITTGNEYVEDYFELSENGYLVFNLKDAAGLSSGNGTNTFEVDAYSELGGEDMAHFNVLINDSVITSFMIDRKRKKYSFQWFGRIEDVDSLMINFDNDKKGEFGDRNLYIKDILVNNRVRINYLNNSRFTYDTIAGSKYSDNNINSLAALAARRLESTGIDPSIIIPVECQRKRMNRTLTSALAVRTKLNKNEFHIDGLNIITTETHSRRTYMIYNSVLKDKYHTGIIALPETNDSNAGIKKIFISLREIIAISYYRVLLMITKIN